MARFAVGELGGGGEKILEFVQAVYGDIGEDGLKKISARYEAVISKLKGGICVCPTLSLQTPTVAKILP